MNSFAKKNDRWVVKLLERTTAGQVVTVTTRAGQNKQVTIGAFVCEDDYGFYYDVAAAPRQAELAIGDLVNIVAMFNRAKAHLKFPAIVLDGFRVSIAGERAKQPGSLTITSADKDSDGKRAWYGRVTTAGVYQPSREAPAHIGQRLREFASDPARVAGEYGRLHGACCFCRHALSDERSTAVGYGPTCADHFGLPWGETQPAPSLPHIAQCRH